MSLKSDEKFTQSYIYIQLYSPNIMVAHK